MMGHLLGLALCAFVLLKAADASAQSATLIKKGGEATQVEVLALEFGKQVKVRLEDGAEETIPWSEVESLDFVQATT